MNFGIHQYDIFTALAVFAVYFAYVFLRAFQQQNVIHANWLLIAPISMGMAFGDAYIITAIAEHGLRLWFAMGVGGFTGCWASMYVHRRYLRNDKTLYITKTNKPSTGVRRADVLFNARGSGRENSEGVT